MHCLALIAASLRHDFLVEVERVVNRQRAILRMTRLCRHVTKMLGCSLLLGLLSVHCHAIERTFLVAFKRTDSLATLFHVLLVQLVHLLEHLESIFKMLVRNCWHLAAGVCIRFCLLFDSIEASHRLLFCFFHFGQEWVSEHDIIILIQVLGQLD